jgi:hypothetical protein
LTKFFDWATENEYTIKTSEGSETEWSTRIVETFVEPGRNKLEGYLKEVFKSNKVEKGGEEVTDSKILAKMFKENKPTRKRADTTTSSGSEEFTIVVDNTLDTADTFYLDTLEFTTGELTDKLGMSDQTGKEDDKHRYEWKIIYDGKMYSIYDWKNEDGEFDDIEECEWHIAGTKEDKKALEGIRNIIKGNFKPKQPNKRQKIDEEKEIEESDIELSDVEESDVKGLDDLEELFGSEEGDLDVEIDLDDIEFD